MIPLLCHKDLKGCFVNLPNLIRIMNREFNLLARSVFLTWLIIFSAVSGAAGFQLTFAPRVSLSEEYTDNLVLSESNEENDFITLISPGFTFEAIERNSGLSLSYDPSYSIYSRFSEYNTWRHRADLSLWTDIARSTRLEITDSFARTEDPLDEDDLFESTGEALPGVDDYLREGRNVYYRNSAGINITHQFGASDSISFGYTYSILENDDQEVENNESHNPLVNLTYWIVPNKWGIETDFGYTRGEYDASGEIEPSDDFDDWRASIRLIRRFTRHFESFVEYAHTVMDYKGEEEGYNVYDSLAGMNYTFAEDAQLSLGVGYFIQDREVSSNERRVYVNGDLGKTWSFRHASINVAGTSGYGESNLGADNLGFNVFYQGQCTADYEFSRRVQADFSCSYRVDDYINDDDDRKDKTTRVSMVLNYQPLEWMNIGFAYSFNTVNSNFDEEGYDVNSFLLRVTLTPSQPFHLN